jgi:hypothetical protein
MPQLVKKRRSGWAVLAVGAMVASILAFGAAPAVAGVNEPDAEARYTACLGPALEANEFTDVSMGSVHYNNINCLAYYGITQGKTADTFDPSAIVTRSQMSLFLTRAASAAGVDLGDVMDEGFTDIDMVSADRRSAINRLAAKGIMEGRTATTFDPGGLVTRADMAQHIFAFLDLAVDTIVVDVLPETVDGDDAGIELLDDDGDGNGDLKAEFFDYFGDARRTVPAHVDSIIGAIYELGVTTGTNNRVGEHGTFEPAANVSRAQMASFIMRTLGHTNLRPEGLTAQQTYTETQVSLRSADFEPVQNQRVEVFESDFAEDAFDRSRRCIDRFVYVNSDNPSFEPCQIDGGDTRTDIYGNATLKPGLGGSPPVIACATGTAYAGETDPTYRLEAAGVDDPAYDYQLWAWRGEFGDTVDSDTELFEAVPANQLRRRTRAVTAVFSGGTHHPAVRMGSTLVYEIQLVNYLGRPVAPNPAGDVDSDQDYIVTITKQRTVLVDTDPTDDIGPVPAADQPRPTVSVTQMTPDNDGTIRIVITNPDSNIASNSPDVTVTVEVQRAEKNNLRFVDTTRGMVIAQAAIEAPLFDAVRTIGSTAPAEEFSDDVPRATSISRTSFTWRELTRINRNSIPVTVRDQYGNPFGGSSIRATSDAEGSDPAFDNRSSDRGGRIYFSYEYPGVAATEVVTLNDITINEDGETVDGPTIPARTATVYWAVLGPAGDGEGILLLLADPSSSALIVDVSAAEDATLPEAYQFGADDTFMVSATFLPGDQLERTRGTALSLEQFVEVLMVANSSDPRISYIPAATTLDWAGVNRNRPTDGASWNLSGLTCLPPPGADREPALAG